MSICPTAFSELLMASALPLHAVVTVANPEHHCVALAVDASNIAPSCVKKITLHCTKRIAKRYKRNEYWWRRIGRARRRVDMCLIAC